jgi:hypothetical protein
VNKKITINLSARSIQKAINDIKNYKLELEYKTQILVDRLSMIGATVATYEFSNAMYAGDNDVQVRVNPIKNGAKIIAEGQATYFIEFGAGIINPEHPQSAEFGFKHGTYGKGQGKNSNGWVYKGEQGNAGRPIQGREGIYRTYGNPPAMAMYKAHKEMLANVYQIAKQVFK